MDRLNGDYIKLWKSISHDIRNELTGIKAMVELVKRNIQNNKAKETDIYLSKIDKKTEIIADCLSDFDKKAAK